MEGVALTVGFELSTTNEVVLLQLVVPSVNVKVTLPADIPVTTPALSTVAIAGLLLTQVPPVVGDKVPMLPTHTDAGAVTAGFAFTVNEVVVLLHPVVVSVNVNVTVPAATPVTTPALSMVAIAGLLLTHVPPAVGDKVPVLPIHNDAGAVTTGRSFIVTVDVVLLQLVVPSVKVKVTLPADTPVITPALSTIAIAGLLLTHVPPAVEDKVPALPTHTDAGAVTTGKSFTVTADVVLLQFDNPSVKVKVTLPADTPVTTPALSTVAIAGLLLTHVPPVVGNIVSVLPLQTDVPALTVGNALTNCSNAPVLVI